METVVCGKCGQRFAIHPDSALQDIQITRKHAAWVLDRLVWDHIQERKHSGTIDLPTLTADKPA
jgi:transcription elongation factor Elf1